MCNFFRNCRGQNALNYFNESSLLWHFVVCLKEYIFISDNCPLLPPPPFCGHKREKAQFHQHSLQYGWNYSSSRIMATGILKFSFTAIFFYKQSFNWSSFIIRVDERERERGGETLKSQFHWKCMKKFHIIGIKCNTNANINTNTTVKNSLYVYIYIYIYIYIMSRYEGKFLQFL